MTARFSVCLVALLLASAAHAQKPGDDERYQVVINHEEQYSIWLADLEPSRAWRSAGYEGTLEETHAYIEEVWTDMRPLSLRQRMERDEIPRDEGRYSVVINHEEQYSLVLAEVGAKRPWRVVGEPCRYRACVERIEEVWTDMRPRALRSRLD